MSAVEQRRQPRERPVPRDPHAPVPGEPATHRHRDAVMTAAGCSLASSMNRGTSLGSVSRSVAIVIRWHGATEEGQVLGVDLQATPELRLQRRAARQRLGRRRAVADHDEHLGDVVVARLFEYPSRLVDRIALRNRREDDGPGRKPRPVAGVAGTAGSSPSRQRDTRKDDSAGDIP